MKKTVISYSLTGNNQALAASIASEFSAQHFTIKEDVQRTNGKIAMDMIFNRTPKVNSISDKVNLDDYVIFVAPVWMGQIASPLRSVMKEFKGKLTNYAFVSISGGALNDNPKLWKDVHKRFGKKPNVIVDMHIADLLTSEKKATMDDTSHYRIDEKDKKMLTSEVVAKIEKS